MRRVEFVKLARKVNYDNPDDVYKSYYFNINPEKDGLYKNNLYLVVVDVYGILYSYEIGKIVRKYSSGTTQSPHMIKRIESLLREREFFLNADNQIEGLEKILKRAIHGCGYR